MDLLLAACACLGCLNYGQAWPMQPGKRQQRFELSRVNRLTGTASVLDPLESLATLCLAQNPKVAFDQTGLRATSSVRNSRPIFKGARAKRVSNPPQASLSLTLHRAAAECGLKLEDQQLNAYLWTSNLVGPASLVAGAALASMYELSKDFTPVAGDGRRLSAAKKFLKLLFVSAFVLEIACVFITTVTGTMLLAKGVNNPIAYHPMEMLHRELEFEYVFCRISFCQGLLNWLVAVAVHQGLPKKNITKAAQRIQRSTASFIIAMVMYMLAFYNRHISYYSNYAEMLARLASLAFRRCYHNAFRILPVMTLIPLAVGVRFALSSFGDLRNEK